MSTIIRSMRQLFDSFFQSIIQLGILYTASVLSHPTVQQAMADAIVLGLAGFLRDPHLEDHLEIMHETLARKSEERARSIGKEFPKVMGQFIQGMFEKEEQAKKKQQLAEEEEAAAAKKKAEEEKQPKEKLASSVGKYWQGIFDKSDKSSEHKNDKKEGSDKTGDDTTKPSKQQLTGRPRIRGESYDTVESFAASFQSKEKEHEEEDLGMEMAPIPITSETASVAHKDDDEVRAAARELSPLIPELPSVPPGETIPPPNSSFCSDLNTPTSAAIVKSTGTTPPTEVADHSPQQQQQHAAAEFPNVVGKFISQIFDKNKQHDNNSSSGKSGSPVTPDSMCSPADREERSPSTSHNRHPQQQPQLRPPAPSRHNSETFAQRTITSDQVASSPTGGGGDFGKFIQHIFDKKQAPRPSHSSPVDSEETSASILATKSPMVAEQAQVLDVAAIGWSGEPVVHISDQTKLLPTPVSQSPQPHRGVQAASSDSALALPTLTPKPIDTSGIHSHPNASGKSATEELPEKPFVRTRRSSLGD